MTARVPMRIQFSFALRPLFPPSTQDRRFGMPAPHLDGPGGASICAPAGWVFVRHDDP
jgi:hypothetical protein